MSAGTGGNGRMFDHWAMPVIRRRWAALAVLFSNVDPDTGEHVTVVDGVSRI